MKKSNYLLLAVMLLCFTTGIRAEEKTSEEATTTTANETSVEYSVPGIATDSSALTTTTNNSSSTETTNASNETIATGTSSTGSTDTSTKAETTTDSSSSTVASDSTSTESATNPFSDSEIKIVASATVLTINDVDVAAACGIKEVGKDFPKDGRLAALDGSNLRLRSWPWGTVIGNYSEGTEIKILGESGEFYLVDINGTQGYMHKNYVTTADKAATGVAPYYPGDTASGGALSLNEGIKASKDGAEGKVPTETVATTSSSSSSTSTSSSSSTPGTITKNGKYVCMDVPKLCQYTTNTPAPGSACGPTSLSMVLGYFGKGNPASIVANVYRIAGCTKSSGTGHAGLEKAAKSYGINASWHYSSTQSYCRQQLEAGKLMVCHVNHHYVVMKGMDANGNVIINDPAKSAVERKMSWSEFAAWWNKSNSPMSCMVCSK